MRRRLHLPSNDIFDPLLHTSGCSEVRTTLLDRASSFRRPLPQCSPADAAALPFFSAHADDPTAPSYVCEIANGIAWGHPTGGVFTAAGQFIPAFTHDPCGPAFHTVWTRLRLPTPQRLAGRTLYLVTPEATDNFHHWLIDLIPRLGLVRRAGFRLEDFDHVVLNHSGRRYQLATLAHLGIPTEKIIRADASRWVQAETLVVPSLKPGNQSFPAADAAFLREAFLGTSAAPATRRRIFLSRADAGYRRLRDEETLYPLLRSLDFEIVVPAQFDVVGQARLFAEADVIAGPAGAAFANLAFASPGTRVIEIVPPQWLAAFHWMISARLGLEHTILLGEGPVMKGVPDSSARQKDLVVDPTRLAEALDRVTGVRA